MKNDIDFDELDRAVTSLMGGATTSKSTDETPQQKTLNINPTLKPNEDPEYEKLDEVAKRIGNEALVTDGEVTKISNLDTAVSNDTSSSSQINVATGTQQVNVTTASLAMPNVTTATASVASPVASRPPVRQAVGRFMDVVHPSSDMKSTQISSSQKETTQPVTPRLQEIKTSEDLHTTNGNSLNQSLEPKKTNAFGISSVPGQVTESSAAPALDFIDNIEVTSPFIADAKVEKRPLGDPAATVQEEPDYSHLDAPEEIVAINSEIAKRLESNKDTQEILDATNFNNVSSIENELREIESKHADGEVDSQSEALRAVESVESQEAAQVPMQGAIYDVKEYHQPVHSTEKKKSGWGVVVIIVIIIILAAAIGVGVYLLLGLGN